MCGYSLYIMVTLENLLRPSDINRIKKMSFGQQKLDKLSRDVPLLEFLVRSGFKGSHVSEIVMNTGWEEKLDWVSENYKTVLKSKEFSQSQTSKILRGKGWQDKVEWIKDHYDKQEHTSGQIRDIMVKKNWRDVLHYKN